MPIYIDVSAAVHRRAGLGRYAESLTQALLTTQREPIALFYNREKGVTVPAAWTSLRRATVSLGYKPWRLAVWAGQLMGLAFDRLLPEASLFHATEHLLMPLRRVPTVLTVHDLIFAHLPQHHKALNRWYLRLTMPLYCRRAERIIAVSQHTRQDLAHLYRIPLHKVHVVYEAADPRFFPQEPTACARVTRRYGLPEAFILYVGTIEPRKNLLRLLRAWEPLYLKRACGPLVLVGRRGWLSEPFFAALEASPARDGVILPGYVADDDLPAVYSAATLFVFPSLYEGFGLPPLESMACGTPVICSDAASLPEVVGDAARLVNPEDVEALRAALQELWGDPDLRSELRERGLARSVQFSWKRAAQETLRVYDLAQSF